jgi:hypothetical protein
MVVLLDSYESVEDGKLEFQGGKKKVDPVTDKSECLHFGQWCPHFTG